MSGSKNARLEKMSEGFRSDYLAYDALTRQLQAWAETFGDFVRLESLATSAEGRDIWLLTIGTEPDRIRPATWVDGNLHASELAGSSVALAIAEDAIRLHLEPDHALHGLPPHVLETLRTILFHIVPRISPDGAEAVLHSGRYVRSVPRDARPNRGGARWRATDVDGDGLALLMRKEDPSGEFVVSKEVPGLMLLRRLEDEGPYFKIYPEGVIEHFDGTTVPDPDYLSDNDPDLNRNFPWDWAPEPKQKGAGPYPASEVESRALVEFAIHHPNLFSWLNLHTFGGVFIRPLGAEPDTKMNPSDLALYRQLGAWAEKLTGYPMVSGFEEFTYEPDKPLHGDLSDFAYHQRGCVSYVCELWDLFTRIGVERKKRFVDAYTHLTREELIELGRWDLEHNQGRTLRPWRPFEHPQLGPVEVGGVDNRVGMWNPPYEMLPEICEAHSAMQMHLAALAPKVVLQEIEVEALGDGVSRMTVTVENHGYLPTYILESAKPLPWNEPLFAEVSTSGPQLLDPAAAHKEVGHLDGWGRGLHDGSDALYFMRSRGTTSSRSFTFSVRGSGTVTVRIGSCRMGTVEAQATI